MRKIINKILLSVVLISIIFTGLNINLYILLLVVITAIILAVSFIRAREANHIVLSNAFLLYIFSNVVILNIARLMMPDGLLENAFFLVLYILINAFVLFFMHKKLQQFSSGNS